MQLRTKKLWVACGCSRGPVVEQRPNIARRPPSQGRKRKVEHLTNILAFQRGDLKNWFLSCLTFHTDGTQDIAEVWMLLRTKETWVGCSFREPAELHTDTKGSKRLGAPEKGNPQIPLTGNLQALVQRRRINRKDLGCQENL